MSRFPKKIAVLALAAAAGCTEQAPSIAPPLDRFYYPTGIAVRQLGAGKSALLVVSSNFDLRYDQQNGGTVLAVDPDASPNSGCRTECLNDPACRATCGDTLEILGSAVIGSFGGEVAVADPATCPGLGAGPAKVLVPSRANKTLHLLDMDAKGVLSCTGGCKIDLDPSRYDPYGVSVVCRDFGDLAVSAFVTHLRDQGNQGVLTQVDLSSGTWQLASPLSLGLGPTYTTAYDGHSRRLFVTSRFAALNLTPLRWLNLIPGSAGQVNLFQSLGGSVTKDIAISSDGRRGYLVLQSYDTAEAQLSGQVVVTSATLAVLSLDPDLGGQPQATVLRLVPLDRGSAQVRALKTRRPDPRRPGELLRDLVAITAGGDGTLQIYDDEAGAVVKSFGPDAASGKPLLGKQPFAMAVEAVEAARCRSGRACDRIYVASFDQSWASLVELDPSLPASAEVVKRIGAERR